jgi:hypothetical protein
MRAPAMVALEWNILEQCGFEAGMTTEFCQGGPCFGVCLLCIRTNDMRQSVICPDIPGLLGVFLWPRNGLAAE